MAGTPRPFWKRSQFWLYISLEQLFYQRKYVHTNTTKKSKPNPFFLLSHSDKCQGYAGTPQVLWLVSEVCRYPAGTPTSVKGMQKFGLLKITLWIGLLYLTTRFESDESETKWFPNRKTSQGPLLLVQGLSTKSLLYPIGLFNCTVGNSIQHLRSHTVHM